MIEKLTIETFGKVQSMYIVADKETIAKIAEFVAALNLKTSTNENY